MSTSGTSKEYERCVLEGYSQPLKKRSQSTKKGVLTLCEGTYFCTKKYQFYIEKGLLHKKKRKKTFKREEKLLGKPYFVPKSL
jgi:hypothetical protein